MTIAPAKNATSTNSQRLMFLAKIQHNLKRLPAMRTTTGETKISKRHRACLSALTYSYICSEMY